MGVAMTTSRLFLSRATNQFLFCCRLRGGGGGVHVRVRVEGTDGRGWGAVVGGKGEEEEGAVGDKGHSKRSERKKQCGGFISYQHTPHS